MRPITLSGFVGSNQAKDPRQLPEAVGVRMVNAYPGLGDLRPLRHHLTVATVPASPQRKTIWRMGRDMPNDALYWLSWSAHVSVTLGFGDDSTERTFFTGSGTPKWTDNSTGPAGGLTGGPPFPQGVRELAVPAPTTQPEVSMIADGTAGTAVQNYVVTTFVNDLGWESSASPPSAGILMKPGATLGIGQNIALEDPPAGLYGITARRIYITQADLNDSADFYFLREIPIATAATTDDGRVRGEILATRTFLPPPADGIAIVALWGGMMAMLSGNGKILHFSEAGYAYAYPLRYQREIIDQGVALAKWGQNLLVLTKAAPVVFQGQDPAGMTDLPPSMSHACVAAASVVSFSHGVVWASGEGLAYYGDRGQGILTEGVLTPEQWAAMDPASMVGGRWGKFYVCSYDDGTRRGFMFDPLNPAGGIIYLTSGFDACHYDDLADALYVLEGGNVRRFSAGDTYQAASFESKHFMQTKPTSLPVCKVVARGYPVQVSVWADGVLVDSRSVASKGAYKTRTGFVAEDWQVRIATADGASDARSVQVVRLAAQVHDLKGA